MIIDWFTVFAQVVNFLVLVWLLKHFLYGPILRAMDKREESIVKRLDDADELMAQAEAKQQKYADIILKFEQEKKKQLKRVEKEVQKYHDELLSEARLEAEKAQSAWRENTVKEQHDFVKQLRRKIGTEVIRLLRISLKDLADEELIVALARVFAGRLYKLDEQQRKACAASARKEEIKVVSSFALKDTEQKELTIPLQSICGEKTEILFTADSGMEPGVVINIGELRLSWGTEEYLDSLEKNISDMIARIVQPEHDINKP